MQLGMIGLGRMGADLVRRLMRHGHRCVVHDVQPAAIDVLQNAGAVGAASIDEMMSLLEGPRILWLMVPAGAVEAALADLWSRLAPGDIVIDGGNSYCRDDMKRSVELGSKGIHFVDVGISGGTSGLARGYCLMIGGEEDVVVYLTPLFTALACDAHDAREDAGKHATHDIGLATDSSAATAQSGYLYCGLHGAGHFVKMIHNGIEYGMMAAYAEGLNILRCANVGTQKQEVGAEVTPLRHPEYYQYTFDLADIAEVWRHGSVIDSWLLGKVAEMLRTDPTLAQFAGRVSDSGEGRWSVEAAIDEGVPAPVLSAALYARFASRGQSVFADKLLSAMRYAFGGHLDIATPRDA
ncbi:MULTISPECIES: phosphogluconate dehydrogenase (NAD(+)-dependent, decarboxylating) [Pandoraea]|uniref:6-phosphogluconate dehydrogenase (Decarboxylating) n=3 Tax=Pandoraea TaxID=93217 RepID=A0A5E4VPY3_9BURK|nr:MULTISPECIES: decarboxylating 6-phosphogluconate dehydrogenase [Pandoraea]PTD98483.1 6-phosphogluconate dehydrogenase (decarboxylating) [Pandoraea apista]RRJ32862.1 decarboxylating 6-phosphogluconate dehydrogenase [Pandoraea apista]RRJ81713.1 decarboxylating 6-phosphogluconate dehydrogenase [Pandoraea apista]RSC97909.1 decarboxylating 6-phosphogluconate dehydrogenase [Pandoraea apista]RSD24371.1 decarboxylating 6-phosphogluconate dehydrogenase [Pandoraea apista]